MDLSFSDYSLLLFVKFRSGAALEDLCYSLQETSFSMLVEVTERALAHSKEKRSSISWGGCCQQEAS